MSRSFLRLLSGVFIGTVLGLGSFGVAQELTLRAADNQPDDYPTVLGLKAMADYVSENSDGRIQMEVFSGGQLGDERSTIEQTQLGVIDIVRTSTSPVGEFYAPMGVFSLPYLFRDQAHFESVLQGEVGQELLEGLTQSDLLGLAYYDSGSRNFYTAEKPIRSVADLAGLRIRTQESQVVLDMMDALGADPVPLPFAEVARRKKRLTENHIDALQKVSLRYRTLWALRRESRYLRPLYDECIARGWHSGLFALPVQQETHTLRLRTLGVPTAELDGQLLVLSPKPLGVLVYLALQGPCSADEIVKAIWEGEEQMRANVRAQIHIIRKAFANVTREGKALIRHDSQSHLYELLIEVSVDALELEKAATGSRREKERAIQSYELGFMLALDSEWANRLRSRFHSAKEELITELSR